MVGSCVAEWLLKVFCVVARVLLSGYCSVQVVANVLLRDYKSVLCSW